MFRLVDKTGDLIVATEHIEIALRLLRTIERAVHVLDENGVVLGYRARSFGVGSPRYASPACGAVVPLAWGA